MCPIFMCRNIHTCIPLLGYGLLVISGFQSCGVSNRGDRGVPESGKRTCRGAVGCHGAMRSDRKSTVHPQSRLVGKPGCYC